LRNFVALLHCPFLLTCLFVMKESGGGPNESGGGSDGGVRLAGHDPASRGRPSSLAVSADQVRPSQQKRKVGIPSMDRLAGGNNNNLLVSDLSDMSSESDTEFLPPRARGESQGKIFLKNFEVLALKLFA